MSVPVISPLTSVLAPYMGEAWAYQPAATNSPLSWKEDIPIFTFTADAPTDVITFSGITLRNGDRIRVTSAGTIPAGLIAGEYYTVRDVAGSTCRLVPLGTVAPVPDLLVIDNGNASSETIYTTAAHGLIVGDRVIFKSLTGGAGLSVDTIYFVESVYVLDDTAFTVSATSGGAAVNFTTNITAGTIELPQFLDITSAGSGTHSLARSAAPPGLNFDIVTGLISGVPTQKGFYQLTLIATNGTGDSASVIFPIGIREPRAFLDSVIGLQWEWDTGLVSLQGGDASLDLEKPLLNFKNGDQLIFAVQFVKAGLPFRPAVQNIVAAVKVEDEEAALVLSDGNFSATSAAPDSRIVFVADTTLIPSGGQSALSALDEGALDGPDVVKSWLELRLGYNFDPLQTGEPSVFYRACRSIPVALERSLIA